VSTIERYEERAKCRCVHFNGIQHEVCKVGVKYDDVMVQGSGLPCVCIGSRGGEGIPCAQRRYPNTEEVAADKANVDELFRIGDKVMAAITADAEAKGYRRGNGGSGEVTCPACADGKLAYRVAGYNGHRHAKCSTAGCVSFME